ncbi:hypothetical protein BDK61_4714 [Haloarcula quadrata]|uniref:Uncharacterized protein n=1 Tax=Haloarcula quadrata TaxID=182779 RepID=A0A495QQB6_9EURY|nr:hypothetical protein BDK61_4714 [Haloarcula quadrata]
MEQAMIGIERLLQTAPIGSLSGNYRTNYGLVESGCRLVISGEMEQAMIGIERLLQTAPIRSLSGNYRTNHYPLRIDFRLVISGVDTHRNT